MKKITWIDLTDIVRWDGQHGGTQRVVYGIAEQYYLQQGDASDEVKFFVFDSQSNDFYETDFEVIRSRVASVAQNLQVENVSASKKEKLKHYVVEYTPRFVRSNDKLRKGIFKAAKITYIQLNNGKKLLKRQSSKYTKYNKNEKIRFTKNDTVLILGKPWDEPKLTPLLADLKLKNNFKLAVVIYDLVIPLYPHLHSPKLFKSYTQYMFEAASGADVLLPISKSTENDLLTFCKRLGISAPKTQVIRLGDSLENVQSSVRPPAKIDPNFLLCVGTIEIRKNHTLLYLVYKLALEQGIDLPQLVIVGRPGWLADDIYHLLRKDQELHKKITVLETVSDGELAWLYENCMFTVYPSAYEGWGLPVAESAQYGKFVLASDASSIPEIAGDSIEYFSPYSTDQCLALIRKYLDPSTLSAAQTKLSKSYKRTSWKDTANCIEQTLKK